MGNCKTACCGDTQDEFDTEADTGVNDSSSKITYKDTVERSKNPVLKDAVKKVQSQNVRLSHNLNQKDEILDNNVHLIIKLQALWRGAQSRKITKIMAINNRGGSRYFTSEECKETLTDQKFDPNQSRQKKGKFTYRSGASYDGEWKGGFRDGYGIQIWPDGAKYDGEWREGRAHGKGTFTHVDGDMYSGQWAYDKANGFGRYTHQNGATYEGFWKDDLQHGKGVEKWMDNSIYDGHYKKGKKHGFGSYEWNDESKFNGHWEENKISGFGTYSWVDGRVYRGEWDDNNMQGYGFYSWRDGRKFRGQYSEDKKHGFGIYSWKDGREYQGNWVKGKQHGLGKYIVPEESVIKFGLWEGGKRINWFDEQQIKEIELGQLDYHQYFKSPESSIGLTDIKFDQPRDFDTELSRVDRDLIKLQQQN